MRRARTALLAAAIALVLTNVHAQPPRSSMFVFQNNFWLNLHQFLRGEIYRRYIPYADRYNQIPPSERSGFERDWQPYLDGKIPFEQALRDLVRDAR